MKVQDLIQAVRDVSDRTWNVAERIAELHAATLEAERTLSELVDSMCLEAINADLAHLAKHVAEQHLEVYRATTTLGYAKQQLDDLMQRLTWEFYQTEDAQAVDPTTGRKNKDYTTMLLGRYLDARPAYRDGLNEVIDAEQNHTLARAELDSLLTQFSAVRYRTRLVTAQLQLMASVGPDLILGLGGRSNSEPARNGES